ncbi:MAG TPA: hypothetical protein VMT30_07455 [Candidatus Saccharimonadia bacterium]|nr:hypothetical protein [Candidatus Saccharimonadia bacterium]
MKILTFDVESNGLHGEAFAVAGVLMDSGRAILSQFTSRCPIIGPVDPWVSENVLGPMQGMADTAADGLTMRNAFWDWYHEVKAQADLIVAANPYPVEARFLIACQEDDMPAREFDHPFPYFDLSSMLYTLGITTAPDRRAYSAEASKSDSGQPHNPLWDAKSTAMTALAAIEQAAAKLPA